MAEFEVMDGFRSAVASAVGTLVFGGLGGDLHPGEGSIYAPWPKWDSHLPAE